MRTWRNKVTGIGIGREMLSDGIMGKTGEVMEYRLDGKKGKKLFLS